MDDFGRACHQGHQQQCAPELLEIFDLHLLHCEFNLQGSR
jgi:hypothetical protein